MDKQRGTRCIMHACASSFLPQMGVSSNQRPIRVVHASDARLDRNYRRSNSLSLSLFPSFFLSFLFPVLGGGGGGGGGETSVSLFPRQIG